jgi:hypothetical protein
MKKLLISFLLCPIIANAEFFTGNDLLTRMNGSTLDQMQALGFVQGVFDVYVDVTICPPSNVTAGQLNDMIKNYLTNIPAHRHLTAESLINQALKSVWPCKQQPAPGRGA